MYNEQNRGKSFPICDFSHLLQALLFCSWYSSFSGSPTCRIRRPALLASVLNMLK